MGDVRTRVFGLCLALSAPALPLCAQTLPRADPVRLFATCTGRLSALMEYQWLVQDPRSDETQNRRDLMAGLLQAALPADGATEAMRLRIEAKVAEAALLSRARSGRDPARAITLTQRQIAECTDLLVSG